MTDKTFGARFRRGILLCSSIAPLAVTAPNAGADIAADQFEDRSAEAGFLRAGETYGASWGDVNGDGYPDLFVSNHRNRSNLFLNNGDGTFVNVGSQIFVFVNKPTADSHGATFMDFDNDGDQDLLVATGSGNPNQFLVNEGGEYIDRTQQYGITFEKVGARLPVWLDYNNDSLPDFIVVNRSGTARVMEQADGVFVNHTAASGVTCTKFHYGQLYDGNGDGKLDLLCGSQEKSSGAPFPQIAYDTETYPFTDITHAMISTAKVVDSAMGDFDGDLREDIFQVRGVLRPSGVAQQGNTVEALLIAGKKGFKFKTDGVLAVDIHWNKTDETNSMPSIKVGADGFNPGGTTFTLDPADPNVAGTPTYLDSEVPLITIAYDPSKKEWWFKNISGSSFSNAYFIVTSTTTVTGLKGTSLWPSDNPIAPALTLNKASGFVDATTAAGFTEAISCASVVAGDFDNDMDEDIYAACRAGAENLSNILYENQGDGTFVPVAGAGGAAGPTGVAVTSGAGTADTVVVSDYDSDGFLDLYVTNGFNMRPLDFGGPEKLFHNRGNANHWVEIELSATGSMRDALGTRIIATATVKDAEGRDVSVDQLRVADGSYHRWAQNDKRIHFGLSTSTTVDLRVEWPSGNIDFFPAVDADKQYHITEGATGENGTLSEIQKGVGRPYVCGSPAMDLQNDKALFLWKDCATQVWKVRASAGASRSTFQGGVWADQNFTSVTARGLEAGDVLDSTQDPMNVRFTFDVNTGTTDGFDFTLPEGATGCFELLLPTNAQLLFGILRTPVSGPFNIQTGASCASQSPFIVSVSDSSAAEDSGNLDVTVTLSEPSALPVDVTLSTTDGSAEAGADYTAVSQVVSFAPGETVQTVSIPLLDDLLSEGRETFTVSLSNPVNALVSSQEGSATATIFDNEVSACGAPDFDPATEAGVFVWQDCDTGLWHARIAPGGTKVTVDGALSSSAAFDSVVPFSIEASDTLDFTTDPARITFSLTASNAYVDGFEFVPASGSSNCFDITGGGITVYVGGARNVVAAPFSLETFESCAP